MSAHQRSLQFYTKSEEVEKLIPDTSYPTTVLQQSLGQLLGQTVALEITDNRRLMISSKHQGPELHLRLHHMFLNADNEVIRALASYLKRRSRRAGAIIDDFIDSHRDLIRHKSRRPYLQVVGNHFNLADIFDAINVEHFDKKAKCGITWGRFARKKRRLWRQGSIHLGTYCSEDALIRIHPVLDQPWVPLFYLRYVVFHEMLHHMMPPRIKNGRTVHHSQAFREKEKTFPDYVKAIAWEEKHTSVLLAESVRYRKIAARSRAKR